MIKTSFNQKGSTHVVIILILVIALLGVLGFIFWQSFIHKEEPVTKQETTIDTKKSTPEVNESERAYLKVNDWGIKLKSSVVSDLSYKISSRTGGPENTEYDQLGLEIKPTSVIDQHCVNFGADLYRQKQPTQFQSKKIGEYYYYVTGAPGICSENDKDVNLQKTVLDELRIENVSEL